MNFELARNNMIEQQIRTWEVLDERVLESLRKVPREGFVPAEHRNLAFADMAIPIGRGQSMLPPKLEARLVQELDIRPQDKILEVGTGSGYVTALLATLGGHVYSVDIVPEFKMAAAEKLAAHGIENVTLDIGDAARGWNRHGPYDVILISGSLPVLPEDFQRSLAIDGRMIAVVGQPPAMDARLVRRLGPEAFEQHSLFETHLPPLINAPQPPKFVF